jgi:hypothetical protein
LKPINQQRGEGKDVDVVAQPQRKDLVGDPTPMLSSFFASSDAMYCSLSLPEDSITDLSCLRDTHGADLLGV